MIKNTTHMNHISVNRTPKHSQDLVCYKGQPVQVLTIWWT